MKPWGSYRPFLILSLLLVLAGACATPPHSPEGDHYLTTDMTYLRDKATFDSNVVGQLYKGDQVEKLDVGPAGWWWVRSGRTGLIGWVSADLFSPTPVPVPLFVVTQTVSLRECPKELCPALQMLSRGDQAQKIEQNDQGWWRVIVIKSRILGWLPAKTLAENLEEAEAAEKPYLYVAVRRLKLLRQPQPEAEVIKLLRANDQVEKLDENPAGWVKIRQPASGAVGWVLGRHLEPLPVAHPRSEKSKKRKVQPQKPPGTKPQPEPQPQPEPEIM